MYALLHQHYSQDVSGVGDNVTGCCTVSGEVCYSALRNSGHYTRRSHLVKPNRAHFTMAANLLNPDERRRLSTVPPEINDAEFVRFFTLRPADLAPAGPQTRNRSAP